MLAAGSPLVVVTGSFGSGLGESFVLFLQATSEKTNGTRIAVARGRAKDLGDAEEDAKRMVHATR